ncbi:MAG: DUF952 domain-containing protein [Ahrensia sp.]|nr:DUF952 domain-containing protein [Ahrensia sp.]
MSHPDIVYKICAREDWEQARENGRFEGAQIDVTDGFIHFSSAAQVRETARRHYAGKRDLLLIAIDATQLGDDLKWEPSRGGDLFPHLHAALPVDTVLWEAPLPIGEDGVHQFPETLI